MYLCIYVFIYLSIHLFIYLSIHLFIDSSIHLFIYSSIYLFNYCLTHSFIPFLDQTRKSATIKSHTHQETTIGRDGSGSQSSWFAVWKSDEHFTYAN